MRLIRRDAFTLIEVVAVMIVMAVMMAITVPRLRVSPTAKAMNAARQVMRDVELVRTKSTGMKRRTRIVFDEVEGAYTAYVDADGDDDIDELVAERNALNVFGVRELDGDVAFGRGNAPVVPGESGVGAVTFTAGRVDFDRRGLVTPFGTRGTVYVTSVSNADAVFAVQISGAGSVRLRRYLNGVWE